MLHVVAAIEVVHPLAQLPQAHVAVQRRIRFAQRWNRFAQRRVLVEMAFELREMRDQMLQLAETFGRREQEQDRVQVGLLGHDAVLAQVARQDWRRRAERRVFVRVAIDAGRRQQQLARVDEILVVRIAFEAMPRVGRMKTEEAQVVDDLLGRVVGPRAAVDRLGNERPDLAAGLQQQLARIDAMRDAVAPQALAGRACMHLRVDVERGEHRVERAVDAWIMYALLKRR